MIKIKNTSECTCKGSLRSFATLKIWIKLKIETLNNESCS
ncbi:hypothetical protein ECDEC15E_4765 [Escherichia coli DEC15E]|nr:hypothetical protein ECDEC15E_4765 [Escherichia coli DEC15E]